MEFAKSFSLTSREPPILEIKHRINESLTVAVILGRSIGMLLTHATLRITRRISPGNLSKLSATIFFLNFGIYKAGENRSYKG